LTPYDVLGYLAPGATFVISLYGFEFWIHHRPETTLSIHTPLYTLVQLALPPSGEGAWALATLFLIGLFGVCYVLGHIVASISAFSIDRMYVAKAHGYPFRLLLGLEAPLNENPLTVPFYRALFFWTNAYILFRFLGLRGMPLSSGGLRTLFDLAADLIGYLIVVLVLAKTFVSARYGHRDTKLKRFLSDDGSKVVAFVGAGIKASNFLYGAITALIGNYLRTHEAFPVKVREAFHRNFQKTFGMTVDEAGTTSFWLSYIHVRSLPDSLTSPAENWLHLYSFARNLGTALYLAFLYCFVWWIFNSAEVALLPISDRMVLAAIPLGLFACAFAMLMRFYYLYADYFSKYVLRAFLYSTEVKDTKAV